MGQVYWFHYGLPEKILMDQGWNFESQLVADLCELMGTWKIWTSLYHPQTNSQYERFKSTLINRLGTLPKEKKSECKNHSGNIGPCIQLHLKFSYRVQPLLPHVWETTLPSSRCSTWSGSMYHHRAKHFHICPEDKRMCQVGSKESWGISGKRSTKV